MRYFKTFILLFLCVSLFFCDTQVWAKDKEKKEENKKDTELPLYAKSAVLIDADSGRVLYGKDEEVFLPNASTTKIMTCILAIESGRLDDTVTVSSYAASMPKVHLGMSENDSYKLKDLLYSLMLESHNDSAVAIAEHIGGDVESFADMMNQKAKELGCTNTHFITPNGLDKKDDISQHGTTAKDLALIMRYCIQNETFLEITRTPQYSFGNLNGTKNHSCVNHNAFLKMMDGALSGKTGFTNDAGYCYVGALTRDERTYIVALLACGWPNNKTYKWKDTQTLMNYGLENYGKVLIKVEKNLDSLPVSNAADEDYNADRKVLMPVEIAGKDIRVLKSENEKVTVRYTGKEVLKAPIKKGVVVGNAEYYVDSTKVASYPLVTTENVRQRTPKWYLMCVWKNYIFT